jgi:nitrous oxide reductase accessory protein NosL
MVVGIRAPVLSGDLPTPKPSKKDKCPVCGMFVYKYPEWVAYVSFKDGSQVFFDGAKDFFKYLFNLKRYAPDKSLQDISLLLVTDYYSLRLIDAKKAFYVVGSDVYGPMGKELIPFESKGAAEEFKKDHRGSGVNIYTEINPKMIERLD